MGGIGPEFGECIAHTLHLHVGLAEKVEGTGYRARARNDAAVIHVGQFGREQVVIMVAARPDRMAQEIGARRVGFSPCLAHCPDEGRMVAILRRLRLFGKRIEEERHLALHPPVEFAGNDDPVAESAFPELLAIEHDRKSIERHVQQRVVGVLETLPDEARNPFPELLLHSRQGGIEPAIAQGEHHGIGRHAFRPDLAARLGENVAFVSRNRAQRGSRRLLVEVGRVRDHDLGDRFRIADQNDVRPRQVDPRQGSHVARVVEHHVPRRLAIHEIEHVAEYRQALGRGKVVDRRLMASTLARHMLMLAGTLDGRR